MTIQELYTACRTYVDRASVYRTVELFETLGIVNRIQTGWKYRIELSDLFRPHHHHFHCNDCGQTTEIPEDSLLEQRLRQLAWAGNFTMQDHQIEIRGRCANCGH